MQMAKRLFIEPGAGNDEHLSNNDVINWGTCGSSVMLSEDVEMA